MKSIWATSIWLYLGDVCFVAMLLVGVCAATAAITRWIGRTLHMKLTYTQLRKFMAFQIAWLFSALVLFKFIILQGGPHFNHLVGTGNHGSVQFSTAGEIAAAALTLYGLYRWIVFLGSHIVTQAKELTNDRY